jgi:hypothetical protein
MATTVRELVATFGLETDEQSFKKAESGISSLKKQAVALGAVFASGALAVGFKKAINLAAAASEQLNVLEVGFTKQLTPSIIDWSAELSKSVGRSEFQIREFVGSAQLMLAPMLGSRDAAVGMSKQMTKLAFDLGSLRDVEPEEAMVALRAALVGQTEPMRKFGVVLTQASLQEFALRQGISKSVQEMTEREKVQLRANFIMEKTAFATDDAANTITSFANASRRLRAQLKDIATFIGSFFLADQEAMLAKFNEIAAAVLDWIKANRELIQSKIDGFLKGLNQIIENLIKFFGRIIKAVVGLWQRLSPLTKQILLVTAAIAGLIAVLALPFGPLLAIITLIGLIIDDFEVWREGGISVIGGLIAKFKEWFDFLLPALRGLRESFSFLWDQLKSGFAKLMAGDFSGAWDDWFEGIKEIGGKFAVVFEELWKKAADLVMGFFGDTENEAVNKIKSFFGAMLTEIQTFINSPMGKIIVALLGAFLGAKGGKAIGQKLGQKLGEFAGSKRIPGSKAAAGFLGEKLGGLLGTVSGALGGGIGASRLLNPRAGTQTSNVNQPTTNININATQQPGEDTRAFAGVVVEMVREETDRQHKQAFDTFLAAPQEGT